MGRPRLSLTAARIARPRSRPGPRYEPRLERLALSKLALKTSAIPRSEVISARRVAIFKGWVALSMTQGPAMRKKGPDLRESVFQSASVEGAFIGSPPRRRRFAPDG